ncbi:hypothetical protein phytr_6770 [Candidatus Phycorickettsia trachydisci]|uniref:Uncharacterized protein n=1 Tax=Candidatus Phycorickettsia trachydisci TaxID=2115978 RepID=A0A2P1P8L1_9RICK|nr:hypothetical protein [Candidatus Phycorickettsia trachydisci]AVP87618.1 hypothetical protein phytr_6770 [Candidatus Phycorickettsia trachydisci]
MSQKLDIQKLAIKLNQEENLELLQNIVDQSNMIKASEQVTLIEPEKPKLEEDYEDISFQWLGVDGSKNL